MIGELSKRRVFRVVSGYAVVCFVCLQIADVAFEPLGIGQSVLKIVIAVMLLALPIVTYIAWVFDVRPDQSIQRISGKRPRIEAAVTVFAVLLLGIGGWMVLAPENPRDIEAEVKTTKSIAPTSQIRSIAVLPLENISNEPDQQYFADGMTATLIGDLGKIRALNVVSRRSVLMYADTKKSLPEIARELNVDALIEGSVIRDAEQVRINVQLIDAHADRQMWSERYERELPNVLALQSDVALAVAKQVRIELSIEEQTSFAVTHTVEPLAFDAYLRGLRSFTSEPTMAVSAWGPGAIEHFQQAVKLDPGFADAWATLGATQAILGSLGLTRTYYGELVNAKDAIQKALDLDDQRGEVHAAMADVLLYLEWDISGARNALQKAIRLSPRHPHVLNKYARFLFEVEGKVDDSLSYSRRAQQLSPLTASDSENLIWLLFQMRQYEQALVEIEHARASDPKFASNVVALVYERLGRARDARDAQLAFFNSCGASCDAQRNPFESTLASGGGLNQYRRVYLENQPSGYFEVVSPWVLALQYGQIGETDTAVDWLERGVRERDPILIAGLKMFPDYDLLRFDSRFQDLLLQVTGKRLVDEDPRIMAGIAQSHVRAGRETEAVVHLEKAIEMYPADLGRARWLYYGSLAHFVMARYEESLEWAERSIAQGGDAYSLALAHFVRASSYAHLDRLDEARIALNEAKRLWPGDLEMERDLRFTFHTAERALQERYLGGLRRAGLE